MTAHTPGRETDKVLVTVNQERIWGMVPLKNIVITLKNSLLVIKIMVGMYQRPSQMCNFTT